MHNENIWPERLKPGDRVEFITPRHHMTGRTGVIIAAPDRVLRSTDLISVRFFDLQPYDTAWDRERQWNYFPYRLKLLVEFSIDRPVLTRDGREVRDLVRTDDPERPFQARIEADGEWRTLTFQANGFFYKDIAQPLDLINVEDVPNG